MLVRVGTITGSVMGWGVAMVAGFGGVLPEDRMIPVMLVTLSVALLASACLALQRHQRPLGSAFELGYEMGRRDAIREATARNKVTPIRRVKGGLSEFNRSVGL